MVYGRYTVTRLHDVFFGQLLTRGHHIIGNYTNQYIGDCHNALELI